MEKRKINRLRFSNPVHYSISQFKKCGGSLAYDISENGLKLQVPEFIPPQTELTIQFMMSPKTGSLEISGNIVWAQKIPYSDGYYVGLKFSKVNPRIQEVVHTHR